MLGRSGYNWRVAGDLLDIRLDILDHMRQIESETENLIEGIRFDPDTYNYDMVSASCQALLAKYHAVVIVEMRRRMRDFLDTKSSCYVGSKNQEKLEQVIADYSDRFDYMKELILDMVSEMSDRPEVDYHGYWYRLQGLWRSSTIEQHHLMIESDVLNGITDGPIWWVNLKMMFVSSDAIDPFIYAPAYEQYRIDSRQP